MKFDLQKTQFAGIALAAIGLIGMALLLPQEKTIAIGEIGQETAGLSARFLGTVRNLELRGGNAFFIIENGAAVKAVLFRPDSRQLSELSENTAVEVHARIASYKGEPELIVSGVRRV